MVSCGIARWDELVGVRGVWGKCNEEVDEECIASCVSALLPRAAIFKSHGGQQKSHRGA